MGFLFNFYIDSTYILVILGAMISLVASITLDRIFNRYSKVISLADMTGREAAERILNAQGISDVMIRPVAGKLTDHYTPEQKEVRLSEWVYRSSSVAAIAVAAHECGHAIQHHNAYVFLQVRAGLVPIVRITNKCSWPLLLFGVVLGGTGSLPVKMGLILFAFTIVFQLATLPVELDASRRAGELLSSLDLVAKAELPAARKVLLAAAFTYVAGLVSSFLQLLRLMLIFGGSKRRE